MVGPEFSRKKIFVMDDEPEMQIFLSNLLSSSEFVPVFIESGTGGIQKILTEPPDLIILNLGRYHERQTRLYQELKGCSKLKDIPVIMLSSLDRKTFFYYQRFKNPAAGGALPEPEAFILKPLEVEELLQAVQTLTGSLKSQIVKEEL